MRHLRATLAASELFRRNPDHQPVNSRRDFNLAAQPAAVTHVESKIEHVLFHRRRLACCGAESFVDVNMTCRARASTTTFGFNTGDVVQFRGFHDGQTVLCVDRLRRTVWLNKSNLDHVLGNFPGEGWRRTTARREYHLDCRRQLTVAARTVSLTKQGIQAFEQVMRPDADCLGSRKHKAMVLGYRAST